MQGCYDDSLHDNHHHDHPYHHHDDGRHHHHHRYSHHHDDDHHLFLVLICISRVALDTIDNAEDARTIVILTGLFLIIAIIMVTIVS